MQKFAYDNEYTSPLCNINLHKLTIEKVYDNTGEMKSNEMYAHILVYVPETLFLYDLHFPGAKQSYLPVS